MAAPSLNALRTLGVAVLLAVLASLTGAVGVAQAQAWGLNELMQTLAQTKSAKARFTEKKYIGFLDQPVESSGELAFTAPDRLEKRTVQPKFELILLEGERLMLEQPGRKRTVISLKGHPEAAAFVESIRATLAGDRAMLEKYYTLELSGRADAWRLTLLPRLDNMRKLVTRIRMEGAQSAVTLIAFEQADGDRSEMRITRVTEP